MRDASEGRRRDGERPPPGWVRRRGEALVGQERDEDRRRRSDARSPLDELGGFRREAGQPDGRVLPAVARSRNRPEERGSVPRNDRLGAATADTATYDWPVPDERDLDIIAALQDDARATYADVAARVGLSASAVHDRVRKLEQQGAILGYSAVVDPQALGLFVTALIAATPLDPTEPDDLPERVAEFPEVQDCYSVAGEASYVLKVRTRTTSDLEDLIRRLREKGNVATRTTIALSIPFEGRPLRT